MKCILEFGVRGGAHVDNITLPSAKLATRIASSIVNMLNNDTGSSKEAHFALSKISPRINWQSSTHFVSVSLLDGEMRGPASAKLWKK